MPFPLHCYHPLTSWSWWSLPDLLANGSLFVLWVQALSLVGRFQASTCWLLSPLISYLLWLFSPLSCSHLSQDYTLDLVIDWFINQTIKRKQTNTQPWVVPAVRQLLYSSFHRLYCYFRFRFSGSILQPVLSTVDFLSVSFFPRVSLCIPALFQPTARLDPLASFSRFYVSCCLGFLPSFLNNSTARNLLSSSFASS